MQQCQYFTYYIVCILFIRTLHLYNNFHLIYEPFCTRALLYFSFSVINHFNQNFHIFLIISIIFLEFVHLQIILFKQNYIARAPYGVCTTCSLYQRHDALRKHHLRPKKENITFYLVFLNFDSTQYLRTKLIIQDIKSFNKADLRFRVPNFRLKF